MSLTLAKGSSVLGSLLLMCAWNLVPVAHATSCTTQSQMTAVEREAFSRTAEAVLSDVQSGNVQNIRGISVPAVAADFKGLSDSVAHLKPLVQAATITVDDLYALDATGNEPGVHARRLLLRVAGRGVEFSGSPAGHICGGNRSRNGCRTSTAGYDDLVEDG